MMNFIKPEYLVSLYLILNKQEEVSLKDLGNYGEKLNKELKEQMIEALFLYSDKYIEEMFSDYKDYFVNSGFNYCTPWIKRKVSNEELSEKFTSYLSNDVLKVACDLKLKEKTMTTEEMIKVMKAFTEGKTIQCKENGRDAWYDCSPAWDWANYEYRIKPELTYRPYHSDEEMLDDIKKRAEGIQHPVFSNIWLKIKNTNSKSMIIGYNATGINLYSSSKASGSFSWYSAFYNFTYLDGSPFGIKD